MPGRIRSQDVEEVKARTNIAEVVGDYVSLKHAGVGSLKGLCPFHDERSPSFHVRPQVGFYHCFGCGESGDVYSFLQKMDHVTFAEAVERLAARLGYPLHYEDGGAARDTGNRARLLSANAAAEEFFRSRLSEPDAAAGRDFLGSRGFDANAAERFGVGYAPKSWDALTGHLRSRGFSMEELQASGLVSTGERGSSYDRFRGRVVWPIRDVTGQTVGFGARRLFDDDKGPKYLNTPETAVYHKAQVLYGLDLAKRDISRRRQVVVVEGYTDVMACHVAGVTTAVATCGTAFGADHITVLRRILGDESGAGEVVFTFDPDAAGQKAAVRAFEQERRFNAQTFVAVGPEGLDPCDLRLAHGNDAVLAMIADKKPMFEFMIRQLIAPFDLDTVEGRIAALRAAAPVVANLRDAALRPGYTRELARLVGVDISEARSAIARAGSGAARGGQTEPGEEQRQAAAPVSLSDLGSDPATRLEREAVAAIVQFPQLVGEQLIAEAAHGPVANPSLRVVLDAVIAAGPPGAAGWAGRIAEEAPADFAPLVRQLAVAPVPERDEAALGPYARGVVTSLVEKGMLSAKAELLGRLRRAEGTDRSAVAALQRELMDLEARRRALRGE